VAYFDTTPDNIGNQPGFRGGENIDVDVSTTNDPLSGGRKISNTAPTESLQYTLNVLEEGLYDIDARVASPDPGASFRIEIDSGLFLPPVTIPDTNGLDNMVTIAAAANVFLQQGPHLLRLIMVSDTTAADNFAGSYNFLRVRPASTGTFVLTPHDSTVRAGSRTQLSLEWTVPVGGWRVLREVDLRLRDDRGRQIWLRFDEATNSVRMYNSVTGAFGKAQTIGSNRILNGPLAKLYLSTSEVLANGPDSPTVVLKFDVKFKGSSRGAWAIETAATDDAGHIDPFKTAGNLTVD
jgi:hypothetical protein